MKKTTAALIATLTVITSHMAFAGDYDHDSRPEQRNAARNAEYFKDKMGKSDNAAPAAKNEDYEFNSRPEERTAKNNEEYFKNKSASANAGATADKKDYNFNSRPEDRLAQRNAAYFQRKQ